MHAVQKENPLLNIVDNLQIRFIEIEYPSPMVDQVFDLLTRYMLRGALFVSVLAGPSKTPGISFRRFLFEDDEADAMLISLAEMLDDATPT